MHHFNCIWWWRSHLPKAKSIDLIKAIALSFLGQLILAQPGQHQQAPWVSREIRINVRKSPGRPEDDILHAVCGYVASCSQPSFWTSDGLAKLVLEVVLVIAAMPTGLTPRILESTFTRLWKYVCPHPRDTLSPLPSPLSPRSPPWPCGKKRRGRSGAVPQRWGSPCHVQSMLLDNAVPQDFYSMFDFLLHVALHVIQEWDTDFSSGMLMPLQLALNVISRLTNWLCFQSTSIPAVN